MYDAVVAGGGAAGMAAAVTAAECGDHVLLLERMDRVGRKLLATGNGRCNLMNTGAPRFPGGSSMAEAVLARCGVKEQTAFWQTHGLRMRQEDGGRVYPCSGQAASVLDVLRLAMENAGVDVLTGKAVDGLSRQGGGWRVTAGHEHWLGSRVIIAGGGCAQPKLGSDGSCYPLLRGQGHSLVRPQPALTQLETDQQLIRGLSGLRVRCGVKLLKNGKVLHQEQGELLFADYGVSGVCVMQCARWAAPGDCLSVNLLTGLDMDKVQMLAELYRRRTLWRDCPAEQLLTGLLPARIAAAAGKAAGVPFRERLTGSLTDAELRRLAAAMEAFDLTVRSVRGFDSAQVTAGGAAWSEFKPETMESRLQPGLYAAGEVLDVDGDCGGFNLMFAFGSGMLAGAAGRPFPWNR